LGQEQEKGMNTRFNHQIRKVLFNFMLGGIALFLGAGAVGLPVAYAQDAGVQNSGKYFTVTTAKLFNGKVIKEEKISGPPTPPPGFEIERQAVSLPKPDSAAGVRTLTVPAFNWVFGCSSVSGAMIAAYYDRNGYPDMYTGPTGGGVMPLDNSSWPTWSDGYDTYPNCPLIASHNGVDGRVTPGSIDDYWVQYNSAAPDPYVGNWTEHTWGDAIGDYMKTSQSAYGNNDGSTTFYNYTGTPTALTCSAMEGYAIDQFDGTYGRKLFYEARGYTVTDCYNQPTDNQIAGGFSFAQLKAEIDAGRPVMINLEGHTVVGVGYDDSSNTVYIHDTWDYADHTMVWGAGYAGMALDSVSIVNLAAATLPTVQCQSASSSGSEATSPAVITVTLSAASAQTVTVLYATSDGTATAGSDYTATSGTLTFAPGDTSKTISVPITNDSSVEGDETFTVTLSSPTNATLGSTTTHIYTILNDDNYGSIQLSSATYSVGEAGGTVTITATRTGGSSGTVGVSYSESNGTATAGSDYTSTSGNLSWSNGDTANKTFTVAITNDTLHEPNETFTVTLSSPTGGATPGSPSSAAVTITDDDASSNVYNFTTGRHDDTVQAALNAAGDTQVIGCQAFDSAEDITYGSPNAISLKGGYDSYFSDNSGGMTRVRSLTITDGTLTLENFEIGG
jgi:Calx-beta domain/Peptidase_C39 like family